MKFLVERRRGTSALVIGALCAALALCAQGAVAGPQDEAEGEEAADEAESQTESLVAQSKGEASLAEAADHMSAGRWGRARDAYAMALSYLPGNDAAREGWRLAQTQLDQAQGIDQVQRERDIQRQRAKVEFENAYQRAQDRLRLDDFAAAQRLILTAQIEIRQAYANTYLGEAEFNAMNARAEKLLAAIEGLREQARLIEEGVRRDEAAREQRQRELASSQERDRLIRENLRRVRQLQLELKYGEALQVIDEMLFIDEHNPAALALRDIIKSSQLYREYVEIQQRRAYSYSQHRLANQEALIAPGRNLSPPGALSPSGVMTYPEDWPQISIRRTHDSGFRETVADRRAAHVLAETTVPVDFSGNSFDAVVSFLKTLTGLNIYVDWKALEFIGVDRADEVELHLAEVSVATALDRVLDQLGDDLQRPQYTIQDGILTISSEDQLRKRTVTVVYDIRDLLFEVPYFDNAPDLDLDSALNQGSQGGGGGGGRSGGGGGGFGGGSGGGGSGGGSGGSIFGDPGDDPERLSREDLVEQIVSIIQDNIDPDGWRDLGGDTGSLQELNGNLIITNTPRNHRGIEGLLAQLREIRALQINVEGRFLSVSTNWFEQIGVDLDLYFNTNNATFQQARNADPLFHLSDFFGANGQLLDPVVFGAPGAFEDTDGDGIPDPPFPQNTPAWGSTFGIPDGTPPTDIIYVIGPVGSPIRTTQGWTPIGFVQDSFNLVQNLGGFDDESFAGRILNLNPALSVGIQFLDDIQVDLLIEATQADRRSVILVAPRLTFFNGQRAWVAVATQTAFVSSLDAVTGDASGAFEPIVSTIAEGFVLDVEGVISADRRYVTMTVIASLAGNLEFSQPVDFSGAAGGGGTQGNAAQFSAAIRLPQIEVSLVQTTVSVPDKGTALLGGQRRVLEIEVESGVPVLSKIPFINRFFTNRITSKDEETLLILIRPEIIIQQENEDLLFPGLSDTLGGAASYLR